MPPYQKLKAFESSHYSPQRDLSKDEIMIKQGQRHLEASCEVIISVLKEKRLPEPTLKELRKELASKEYTAVLTRSQQYINCLPSPEGAVLVLTGGWESLCRLNQMRLKQAKRQWQEIKLAQEPGDLRVASKDCQEIYEECAASHLGLYKANAWKNRLANNPKKCMAL